MNWAQIIAASIIAFATILNIFFTLKFGREKAKQELNQKYIDRQSNALENWWLLTMRSEVFTDLNEDEQNGLLVAIIWLPKEIFMLANNVIKSDDGDTRNKLRSAIREFVENRT